jgi:spoIIIJ-associated protein
VEDKLETARRFTEGILDRMGVDAEVSGGRQLDCIQIDIRGDREELLIGKGGRTLDALQTLINRMVNRGAENPVRVFLDIDEYRKKREEFLSRMAVRLGTQVKESGNPVVVGPYTAHDRRIIHMVLREESSLRTESLGDGDTKKIKIFPLESEK